MSRSEGCVLHREVGVFAEMTRNEIIARGIHAQTVPQHGA